MRWILAFLCVLAVFGVAPNLYWLRGSSVLVRNLSPSALIVRLALADDPDQLMDIGEIGPGKGHFQWLHVRGEATLEIDVHDGTGWRRHCREYLEQSTYRIEVTIDSPREVTCETSLAVFDHLLIADYMSGL